MRAASSPQRVIETTGMPLTRISSLDEKGNPWLTWGSFWDGIQLIKLDKKTMHVKKAPSLRPSPVVMPWAMLSAEPNPTSKFAGTNAIEAPFIMKHGGYYYLFVSWDYCCRGIKSNYRVAVGRSKKVAGPYLDKDGKDMRNGGGTLLLEGDKKEYEAMGHCSAYSFPDGDYFFCHGYSIAKEWRQHPGSEENQLDGRWVADAGIRYISLVLKLS